jgi:hypothetical protein
VGDEKGALDRSTGTDDAAGEVAASSRYHLVGGDGPPARGGCLDAIDDADEG